MPFRYPPTILIPLPPGRLWIPGTAQGAPPSDPRPDQYWNVTFSSSELFGAKKTLPEIHQGLRHFDRLSVLILLSKLNILLDKVPFNERLTLDVTLARTMFDKTVRRRAAEFLWQARRQATRYYWYSEQQVSRLTLLALRYSKRRRTPIKDEGSRGWLGRLLLAINDHLDPLQDEPVDAASLPAERLRSELLEMLLRNGIFNHHERFDASLCRNYDLFIRLPQVIGGLQIDLRSAFHRATGLDPFTYMALGFAMFAHWAELSLENAERFPILLNPSMYFRTSRVRKSLPTLLRRISAPENWYVRRHDTELSHVGLGHYAVRPLAERPLLRLRNGHLLCLSWRYLREKLTTNLYYEVLSGLPDTRSRNAFLDTFGRVLEAYVQEIFRRMYPAATQRFHEILYGRDNEQAGDGIVLYPDTLIIVEVKSARLLAATSVTGDVAGFDEKLDKAYLHAARQIDRVIQDFKAGQFRVAGIAAGTIRRYVPLLLTIQHIPQDRLVWEHIEQRRKTKSLLMSADIERLQIMHIEELETIEPLVYEGHSLLDLIDTKSAHPVYQHWTYTNYLHHRFRGGLPPNEHIRKRFRSIGRLMQQALLGVTPRAEPSVST